jgi:hypothetical protein
MANDGVCLMCPASLSKPKGRIKNQIQKTIVPADAPIASLLHVCLVLEKSKMQMHVIAVAPSQSIVAFAS